AHVGYYLIGNGLRKLEKAAGLRFTVAAALRRAGGGSPLALYLGSILLLTLAATAVIVAKAHADGVGGWLLLSLALLALIATSQLALSMVNWWATLIATPRPLPRMDFSDGIPLESRSLVVVPTMLFSRPAIDSLTEALEVCFLANRDDNLSFCLLTDFGDAKFETLPADQALLDRARENIEQLNAKYGHSNGDNFLLRHRPRRWNAQEGAWMGYERKRGKLAELNAHLRGGGAGAFSLMVGDSNGISEVRYVITLDTDTILPRDAARQFVATMAHPLNRAQYDAGRRRVCAGYGILQPRVAVSVPGAEASRYELLCGGEAGIDPYTRSVSDVYQDLFGEGSFIGKGIYDVDAFERVLSGRLPENRILSHDLLEGCYARAGLLSDVQLYEACPPRYSDDVSRRQRWIRGDWQVASWLLPSTPGARDTATGKISRERNPLSPLSRWKLFDNLRRSLVSPALTAFLLTGWLALPSAWFWTGAALFILLMPALSGFVLALARKPDDVLLRQHLSATLRSASQHFLHGALMLCFLPYEAGVTLDAIVRTHWRVLVSHRRLLEWRPSGQTQGGSDEGVYRCYRSMWIAPALAIATAAALIADHPLALAAAAPILLLWLASPAIAHWISRPIARRPTHLSHEQIVFLGSLARKIWLFFETTVGPEDHWLPPDNVQERPVAAVAHRTSPTNIGLSLLANLAAHDFGYIPAGQLLERCRQTLQTMAALERYQGHFYNWYDTQTLKPLPPNYISTVDSGNLAGHLLTLRPGLTALLDAPILAARVFPGIRDTYRILRETAGSASVTPLLQFEQDLESACQCAPDSLM
ncbi:MAG TPA: cyclic beta 1-2 glucan synthetase, partial [Burkholderiales bacterium]|nr:cyclic beta 1-2 glucan synthetase [Burkholderiales bacterium]